MHLGENVLEVFPTPVYTANIRSQLDTREVYSLLQQKEVEKNEYNAISKNRYVLDNFPTLKEVLRSHVNNMFYKYLGEDSAKLSLRITQSWLNFNDTEDRHHEHYHDNSILSGVFYLSCDENTGNLNLYKPSVAAKTAVNLKTIKKNFDTPFSTEKIWLQPNPYDLIIFPSYLIHGVDANQSKKTRISLAFNTFYSGIIGAYDEDTELVLK